MDESVTDIQTQKVCVFMCVYIYIGTHTYAQRWVSLSTIFKNQNVCFFLCVFIYVIHIHIRRDRPVSHRCGVPQCVFTFVCAYISMGVCIHTYQWMWVHIHTYICGYMYIHIHIHTHIYICGYAYICAEMDESVMDNTYM